MSKSGNDYLIHIFCGHGGYIVDLPHDHSALPPIFAEDMKIGDKYVVWDGNSEEPSTEDTKDMLRHQCAIMSNGELISISEMLAAIIHKNPLVVPIIVFACKEGQASIEKKNQ